MAEMSPLLKADWLTAARAEETATQRNNDFKVAGNSFTTNR